MKKKWAWDKDLSKFAENFAWNIFRAVRWNAARPLCIYCGGSTRKTSKRKSGNQFLYACKKCNKGFTDLTGTPFHKSRLPMRSNLFLTVLVVANAPKKRIARLMGIAKTTVIRHAEEIYQSELCHDLAEKLTGGGITLTRIIEHLAPDGDYITCRVCKKPFSKLGTRIHRPERFRCPTCRAEISLNGKKLLKIPKLSKYPLKEDFRGIIPSEIIP